MIVVAAGPDGRPAHSGTSITAQPLVREWAGRKVRTPQSSVPDNVRDGGFKSAGRKVPQKTYRLGGNAG
jgi:hypothetical protein